ncbi:cyclin-dependent kinase 1 [Enteropsectra breve]|nr:cyclin-dependent kinase 1 [Enteropsectra breve]
MLNFDKKNRKTRCCKYHGFADMEKIGEGTFGHVFLGYYKNKKLAIKKLVYSKDPLHLTSIREIKMLRSLFHPNIVQLEEIVVCDYQIYLVMPYYEFDLRSLINTQALSLMEVKEIFYQIVEGVKYMHDKDLVHRDLKTANILIDVKSCSGSGAIKTDDEEDGEIVDQNFKKMAIKNFKFQVKICDFGMSREMAKDMTPGTVTLWYRAPELLLGASRYGKGVDIWSLGCILYETLTKRVLFKEDTEMEQLKRIVEACGLPNENSELHNEYLRRGFERREREFEVYAEAINQESKDFLSKIFVLDPLDRITAKECLADSFFDAVR